MKPIEPSALIDKYLKGECSPSEEARLHEWFDSFENQPDYTAGLDEQRREQLKNHMLNKIKQDTDIGPAPRIKYLNPYIYAIAGVAAVLVIVFFLILKQYPSEERISAAGNTNELYYRNSTNRLVKHLFPDGSVAWLRPGTFVKYSSDFNQASNRFLTMDGEAFFEVARNPKRPFIVQTGTVFTKVLGTSFNVKSKGPSGATEVSVVTGKVLVYEAADRTNEREVKHAYLLPHEKVIASSVKHHFVKTLETNKSMDIWQKNNLSFNNTPVLEVVKALNDRFKTNITILDKQINTYQLTADFTDANLPAVLELLSKSLGIAYEIDNDKITMSNIN